VARLLGLAEDRIECLIHPVEAERQQALLPLRSFGFVILVSLGWVPVGIALLASPVAAMIAR